MSDFGLDSEGELQSADDQADERYIPEPTGGFIIEGEAKDWREVEQKPDKIHKIDNENEMLYYQKVLSLVLANTRIEKDDVENIGIDVHPAGDCQNCPDGDRVIKGFYITFKRFINRDDLNRRT